MNQKIGTCALCKRENVERKQSHIIPKGVYRRSRTKRDSRFKNHFRPEEIFQDGEKKYMLCGDCEQFFNWPLRKFCVSDFRQKQEYHM